MNIAPKTVKEMYGTDYGLGVFKYRACDFCDDVVAETADIAIGDVWLPKHMGTGTSLIIVRDARLYSILKMAKDQGELFLDSLTATEASRSQAGGFRHRRDGLSYRLGKEKGGNGFPRNGYRRIPLKLIPSIERFFH